MSEQIVAVSVDKIQTFLTEAIHSHVQEKQTEEATLRSIVNSSNQISKGFFEAIKNKFPEESKEMLLKCSGVCVFRCKQSELELENKLNELFVDYYKESQGQKQIRWTYFPSGKLNNIDAIQKAKKCLKQSKNWNKILEKNKELLFDFCAVQEKKDNKQNNCEAEKEFPRFVKDINALGKTEENEQEDKKRFRIAVLKADLDGMGKMFKNISEYEKYKRISQILNEEISLEGLHRAACKCAPGEKDGWLFPLYIAGDDIFFAVAVENLICGINVCREMMQTVNQKIQKSGNAAKLSISIGVEITLNRQPIRYYLEMVEAQLKHAKSSNPTKDLLNFLVMKISICNLTFFDMNYKQIEEDKKALQCLKGKKRGCKCENCEKKSKIDKSLQSNPIWSSFLTDVKALNYIRHSENECSELLGKPSFFYTLLEDILSDEIQQDNVKYFNHVLYHLLPKYFEASNPRIRKMELILNNSLISQLYKKEGIILNEDTKHRFETYLRLMLLFCDTRFHISAKEEWKQYEKRYGKNKKEIYCHLFERPRTYLYENCLIKKKPDENPDENSDKKPDKNEELTNVFVKETSIDVIRQFVKKEYRKDIHKTVKKECKKIIRIEGYQKLVLEKSMFFRLRQVDSISIEKAAKIIEMRNPSTPEEEERIKVLNEERKKNGKLPNRLYFEKDIFCKIAEDKEVWNPDFVDSLMLFYQYNEMVIKFKSMDSKKEDLSHEKHYKNKSKKPF